MRKPLTKLFSLILVVLLTIPIGIASTLNNLAGIDCDNLTITVTATGVSITGNMRSVEYANHTNWQYQSHCNNNCGNSTQINLSAGTYRIKVFRQDYSTCEKDVIVGGTPPMTTCNLLASTTFPSDLCGSCLTEVAVYEYQGQSYLVYIPNTITCADGAWNVYDCDTGNLLCMDGGIAGLNQCSNFFASAIKTLTVVEEDCTLPPVTGGSNCDNLTINSVVGGVSIIGSVRSIEYANHSNWQYQTHCNNNCSNNEQINLSTGTYRIKVFRQDYSVCEKDITVGGTPPTTTCNLLASTTFPSDLCGSCLTEIAVYEYQGQSYLVYFPNTTTCSDGATTVFDCDTGNTFCMDGGIAGLNQCSNFFASATKTQTVVQEDCTLPPVTGGSNCDNLTINAIPGAASIIGSVRSVEYANHSNWQYQMHCNNNCGNNEQINLPAGTYRIKVFRQDYSVCEKDITIGNNIGCPCTADYAPVCGADNITYDNACKAACAGTTVVSNEPCDIDPPGIGCDNVSVIFGDFNIVISAIGGAKPYSIQYYDDDWQGGYLCNNGDCTTEEVIPVLGPDFYNIKIVLEDTWESCDFSGRIYVPCQGRYSPICGVNGITYDNSCALERAGVEGAYSGECNNLQDIATGREAELTEFNAFQENRIIDLEWITSSSYRSEVYVIEKSTNGTDFSELITLEDDQHSFDPTYFQGVDNNPTLGTNYYRLKQVFKDGTYKYANIIHAIDFNIDLKAIDIYPNPSASEVFLNLKDFAGQKGQLLISNQFGEVVEERLLESIPSDILAIDLAAYQNGVYFIKTRVNYQQLPPQKFVVSKMY